MRGAGDREGKKLALVAQCGADVPEGGEVQDSRPLVLLAAHADVVAPVADARPDRGADSRDTGKALMGIWRDAFRCNVDESGGLAELYDLDPYSRKA